MTTLVIGGTGFIGSRVLRLLLERGEPAVCMDINPGAPTVADLADRVKLVRGDVTQFDDVISVMLAEKPDRVLNLSYYLGSEHAPRTALKLNIIGMDNCFEAARLSGNSDWRILAFQILPNVFPILVVQMSLTMGYAILNAAGLSFIGLGVRPPTPEWGIMVAEGAAFMVSGEWWNAFFPGLALMVAVFCFNLLGDGLRDMVDPRRRT